MCEYSGRLIAWMDQELPDEEATNVAWHLGQCAECRQAVRAYEEVSGAFPGVLRSGLRRQGHGFQSPDTASVWMTGGLAAAALLVALLLLKPRTEQLTIHAPSPPHAPQIAFERPVAPAPMLHAYSRRTAAPVPVGSPVRPQWIALEPTVEVALPAEALFPPGAVPPGFSFIADVRP